MSFQISADDFLDRDNFAREFLRFGICEGEDIPMIHSFILSSFAK
jgi:hypothetical protein